jgi:hypothetical protein
MIMRIPALSDDSSSRVVGFLHAGLEMNMILWAFVVLLVGLAAAVLIALVRRGARRAEPILRGHEDSSSESKPQTHDIMTTSAGTRLLLRDGRLVVPEAKEVRRRARDAAKP